jgi:hypothetical protein
MTAAPRLTRPGFDKDALSIAEAIARATLLREPIKNPGECSNASGCA